MERIMRQLASMFFRMPMLSLTLLGLLFVWIAGELGVLYDSGGAGSVLLYTGVVLRMPVNVVYYALDSLELGSVAQLSAAIAGGLLLAAAIDALIWKLRRRAREERARHGTG